RRPSPISFECSSSANDESRQAVKTEVVTVDPQNIDPSAIARAAALLLSGEVVAIPTETVYGLGANALSAQAVQKIFEAKGRPANNPIIVHVLGVAEAKSLVLEWPTMADQLAARFWPGPLTMVLAKGPNVPDLVTAGGSTVALRSPAHPTARSLL